MTRTNTVRLRAREIVDRLDDDQARRLAELSPEHIPVAVGPDSAERFDRCAVDELRHEIARLLRQRNRAA